MPGTTRSSLPTPHLRWKTIIPGILLSPSFCLSSCSSCSYCSSCLKCCCCYCSFLLLLLLVLTNDGCDGSIRFDRDTHSQLSIGSMAPICCRRCRRSCRSCRWSSHPKKNERNWNPYADARRRCSCYCCCCWCCCCGCCCCCYCWDFISFPVFGTPLARLPAQLGAPTSTPRLFFAFFTGR